MFSLNLICICKYGNQTAIAIIHAGRESCLVHNYGFRKEVVLRIKLYPVR